VEADLSTAEGAEKVVSSVRDRLGSVDILVNNVGGSSVPGGGFAAPTDDDWQHALNSNLFAAVVSTVGCFRTQRGPASFRSWRTAVWRRSVVAVGCDSAAAGPRG
jgi:NAD(P)-dependent dehydrogenase (short-subunit alcohol dehydrogenase family)